jgi:tetratricopeptide (TPR) repeat protein
MSKKSFEHLLVKADQSARLGDWSETRLCLEKAIEVDQQNSGVLTELGSTWLRLGNPETAISYFRKVVKLNPDSAEAHNNLGVAYMLAGKFTEAINVYQKALVLEPEHRVAWKNLAVAYLGQGYFREGVEILAALIKTNPHDNEAMLLLAECYQQADDLTSARTLYQEVIKYDPDNLKAKEALEIMPISARQQSRVVTPKQAKRLASLKSLATTPRVSQPKSNRGNGMLIDLLKVAFYGPPEASVETRLAPVVNGLANEGHKVKIGIHFDKEDLEEFDVYVFSRPHTDQNFLKAIKDCAYSGKRIIIDLDEDFHHIPKDYPGYAHLGPGNPQALINLDECLALASALSTSSSGIAEHYRSYLSKIKVIPPSWSASNPMWRKPAPTRKGFHLGVMANHTHPLDIQILGNSLNRLLIDHPDTILVIGFALDLYKTFPDVPEERKLFIPAGRLEDYPYTLANFDILLFPLIDHPYNQIRSDLPLMEAGARKIPWVATPTASFQAWKVGGLFAEDEEDWRLILSRLIDDVPMRNQLGEDGKQAADNRESLKILPNWRSLLT